MEMIIQLVAEFCSGNLQFKYTDDLSPSSGYMGDALVGSVFFPAAFLPFESPSPGHKYAKMNELTVEK